MDKGKSICLLRFSIVLGKAIEPWKGQVATFRVENNSFNELLGMDGEPIEFEWKKFTGFTALEILHRIQCDTENSHIEPEQFSDRILFLCPYSLT